MVAARIELRATTTLVGFSSAHSIETPIADQCDVLWRLVGARGEITIGESLNSEHAVIKAGTKTREQRSPGPAPDQLPGRKVLQHPAPGNLQNARIKRPVFRVYQGVR